MRRGIAYRAATLIIAGVTVVWFLTYLAVIRTESRSWKMTASSLLLGLGFAWMASFSIYQGGRLLGFQ